jgi:hypothetical protein
LPFAGVAALAFVAPSVAVTAAARTPDPCKLLERREIADQFGAAVARPRPGESTAATVECSWAVADGVDRPGGTLTVGVMHLGATAAYKGLRGREDFVPVSGLSRSVYQPTTGALSALRRGLLVTVQGVFLTAPPVSAVDVRSELVPLVRRAVRRLLQ